MSHFKYPKTFHLPWSEGLQNDDRLIPTVDVFHGRNIIVTEKMDGENTSMYRDHIHARSLDSKHHPSRNLVKALHGVIQHEIPEGWRICGENLYATHSIHYRYLPSYFLVFGIYDDKNVCLSWDETLDWCGLLGLQTVPLLYRGPWDEDIVKDCWTKESVFTGPNKETDEQEGYVLRVAEAFDYEKFGRSVAKFVRKNHVQTDEHWLLKPVVPNGVISNADGTTG